MKILIKKLLLLLAPLFILTLCYIISDPYQSMPWHKIHSFDLMKLSRGDISTKMYLQNVDKYQYDSFIFGSSRATAHTSKEWKKYLPQNSRPFSFGGWNETIERIYKRMNIIDSLKEPLKNVFIVIDLDHSFNLNKTIWDHYLVTGVSKYDYYMKDYINYLRTPRLVIESVDYYIFHKQRAYMKEFVDNQWDGQDPVTNDWYPHSEETILKDSANYYKNSWGKFYARPAKQQFSKVQITKDCRGYLDKINVILKKHKATCKIVIAPLYDQIKINPEDKAVLDSLFGRENVFDYSGINVITQDKFNYGSDVSHYRKKVGNIIYREIYK